MDTSLRHAREVVGEATEVLVGPKSLRERLQLSAKILLGIAPGDFRGHDEIQSAFDEIHSSLTSTHDEQLGSYAASVAKMSGPRMAKLAAAILNLDRLVRAS